MLKWSAMAFSDLIVLKTLERLGSETPLTYSRVVQESPVIYSESTFYRCIERLERAGAIRRIEGYKKIGFRYEVIASVSV